MNIKKNGHGHTKILFFSLNYVPLPPSKIYQIQQTNLMDAFWLNIN